MPTPTLALLHQLLIALHIPVLPPSINAVPPSLLLIVLEKTLSTRLPLRHPIRLCQTAEDELAVVKCILGVLADDILGMDLSIIDPVKVVMGSEQEMAVIVMALVVVAKRNGLIVRIPSPPRFNEDILDEEESAHETMSPGLPAPILPDISYPALTSSSPVHSAAVDVFDPTYPLTNAWTKPEPLSPDNRDVQALNTPSTPYTPDGFEDMNDWTQAYDPYTCVHDEDKSLQTSDGDDHFISSLSSGNTQSSGKTVLHQMLEEFGIEPYG